MHKGFTLNDICCVVVTYNGTCEVIDRLCEYSEYLDCIVIDNNSEASFKKELYNIEDKVKVLYNNENVGLARALNQGNEYADEIGKEFILTLDQDSKIEKSTVIALLDAIDIENGVVSVGPGYGRKLNRNETVKYLITSGNLIYRKVLNKIKGFPSSFFIDGIDIYISFKLRHSGYTLKRVSSRMQHKVGEYEETYFLHFPYLTHAPWRFYYIYRNTIWIIKTFYKNMPLECFKLLFILFFLDTFKILFVENKKKLKLKNAFLGLYDGTTKKFLN